MIDSGTAKPLLSEMLASAGVTVLTHTLAARPILDGTAVNGAYIESKAGRQAVLARVVVDATGEPDLAAQTGCPMRWTAAPPRSSSRWPTSTWRPSTCTSAGAPIPSRWGWTWSRALPSSRRNWVERGIFFFPGGGRKWDLVRRAVAEGRLEESRGILYDLHALGLYGLAARIPSW